MAGSNCETWIRNKYSLRNPIIHGPRLTRKRLLSVTESQTHEKLEEELHLSSKSSKIYETPDTYLSNEILLSEILSLKETEVQCSGALVDLYDCKVLVKVAHVTMHHNAITNRSETACIMTVDPAGRLRLILTYRFRSLRTYVTPHFRTPFPSIRCNEALASRWATCVLRLRMSLNISL
ncbi:hypothetical protein EVAR_56116_1 [Eumeta japonica]|uniref:Uncharacterized protein n=1 Tax=Eumeta variegata TaxID=151549 RepID=A0A4C1YD58_EUMVA|nr:hypothetical protein EVAR_56116_1 [Eumeta japonica]